jgi:hypothetical protein
MSDLVEFVPLGPCPECGTHRWREAVCECSHTVSSHDFGKRQGKTVRTACSHMGPAGFCGCKIFREVA